MSKKRRRTRKPKGWPLLPTHFMGSAGPVRIEMSDSILPDKNFLGTAELANRAVRVARGMSPHTAYYTLFHEVVEMALIDSGVHQVLKTDKLHRIKEAICDAVALALLAQFKFDNGLD